MYVKALADGAWLEVPIHIERATEPDPHAPPPPKLVRTLVQGARAGTVVGEHGGRAGLPGTRRLASVRSRTRAWFLNQPHRAERVDVVAGQIVVFHNDEDAQHFIEQGLAERVQQERGESSARGVGTEARQRVADGEGRQARRELRTTTMEYGQAIPFESFETKALIDDGATLGSW